MCDPARTNRSLPGVTLSDIACRDHFPKRPSTQTRYYLRFGYASMSWWADKRL